MLHELLLEGKERVQLENSWKEMGDGVRSSGNNTKTKKASLRNKMKKHNYSKARQAAIRTLELRVKETWKTCSSQVSAQDICTTEKIFRSVYFLAKSNRCFLIILRSVSYNDSMALT